MVKANAYGHGIASAFPGAAAAPTASRCSTSPRPSCCATLGWRGPILLLEGCFDGARPRDLLAPAPLARRPRVAPDRLLAALKTDRPHRVFLKMNSGMNRLGFAPDRYRAAWLRLDALAQVEEIVLMTHLANADADDVASVEPALAAFEAATHDLPGERSVCNSAATLRFGARLAARRRGLGAAGHPALRLVARPAAAQRRRLAARAGDDACARG